MDYLQIYSGTFAALPGKNNKQPIASNTILYSLFKFLNTKDIGPCDKVDPVSFNLSSFKLFQTIDDHRDT